MGECFFWYRPTRVVLDQRPLNGCVCVCVCVQVSSVTETVRQHHDVDNQCDKLAVELQVKST